MKSLFEGFLRRLGIKYNVERNGKVIDRLDGLRNTEKSTGKKYIGFMPGTDIKANDVLINEAGERVYVTEVETAYIQNQQPEQLKAFFISEAEKSIASTQTSVFNIQNAYNSIIGNQSISTINFSSAIEEMREKASKENEDKEQLDAVINLLEMIVNNQIQPSKGLFSKFSNLMEKHSWLTSSIASLLINWIFTGTIQ